MENFEKTFENWLEESLKFEIPENVVAFSFNLDESAYEEGYCFGVELIGAERFDPDDEDWACDEIWAPVQRKIHIPINFSASKWETCLMRMKDLVKKIIYTDGATARKLRSKQGLGIGFVDGNLENIWQSK